MKTAFPIHAISSFARVVIGWSRSLQAAANPRLNDVQVRRTYTTLPNGQAQLHEEYQVLGQGAQAQLKHGYYKEYNCYGGQLVTYYNFKHGRRHGKCVDYAEWHNRLQPAQVCFYRNGRRHGPFLRFAPWGKEEEGHHAKDLREGRWMAYRPDGTSEMTTYKGGKLHGPAVSYAANGREIGRLYYERGRLITGVRTESYPNGASRRWVNYAGGQRQSWSQSWYSQSAMKPRPWLPISLQAKELKAANPEWLMGLSNRLTQVPGQQWSSNPNSGRGLLAA